MASPKHERHALHASSVARRVGRRTISTMVKAGILSLLIFAIGCGDDQAPPGTAGEAAQASPLVGYWAEVANEPTPYATGQHVIFFAPDGAYVSTRSFPDGSTTTTLGGWTATDAQVTVKLAAGQPETYDYAVDVSTPQYPRLTLGATLYDRP